MKVDDRERDGMSLLENLADFVKEDIRIGQVISLCLNDDEDLFLIENSVLLKRLRELRGIDNDNII